MSVELDQLAEELKYRIETDEHGTIRYRNENNEVHRVHGPAVIWANGTKHWFQDNKRHRLDGPAITCPDGTEYWYQNGRLHRLNGPAIIRSSGEKLWFINSELYAESAFNAHPDVIAYAKSKQQ